MIFSNPAHQSIPISNFVYSCSYIKIANVGIIVRPQYPTSLASSLGCLYSGPLSSHSTLCLDKLVYLHGLNTTLCQQPPNLYLDLSFELQTHMFNCLLSTSSQISHWQLKQSIRKLMFFTFSPNLLPA